MELTLWTYEGPPHVGAMRIATSMEGVHYVLHAPQGDTYADLLFTMIERRDKRPPVTYTTFQARDLGGDTAELVKRSISEAVARFQPEALLVGESCTAELIQDQPGALAGGMDLGGIPVVSLELPAYSKKENWGAAETLYQLVRGLLKAQLPSPGFEKPSPQRWQQEGRRPRVNLLGPSLLGFRCRDDIREITGLLGDGRKQLAGLDLKGVAEQWKKTGQKVEEVASMPELKKTFVNLDGAITELRGVVAKIDAHVGPAGKELTETLTQAKVAVSSLNDAATATRRFLASHNGLGEEVVGTLSQLNEAAAAVREEAEASAFAARPAAWAATAPRLKTGPMGAVQRVSLPHDWLSCRLDEEPPDYLMDEAAEG